MVDRGVREVKTWNREFDTFVEVRGTQDNQNDEDVVLTDRVLLYNFTGSIKLLDESPVRRTPGGRVGSVSLRGKSLYDPRVQ